MKGLPNVSKIALDGDSAPQQRTTTQRGSRRLALDIALNASIFQAKL